MKRARKSFLSFGKKTRTRTVNRKSAEYDYSVSESNKIDFQMKYYGKVFEDEENADNYNSISENEFSEENDLNNSENTEADDIKQDTNDVGDDEVNTENQDDDAQSEEFENSQDDAELNSSETPENDEEFDDSDIKIYNIANKQNSGQAEEDIPKTSSTKKRIVIFSISLAVIIVTFVASLAIGGMFGMNSLFNPNSITDDYTAEVDEVTGKVNVLILGVDKEGLRTDTIIVASFDTDDSTVNMLSIPRDTRIYAGSKYQKINAAHALTGANGKIKGPQGSIEAVSRLTGIPINYYVEFSFDAFKETIDALGGIYFDVPQNMKYSDPTQGLYINLQKGYQFLDGDKAEQLVRFRSYPEGDIKRVRVQQSFIQEVANQKLNVGIVSKIPDLFKTLSKNIDTNFTLRDVTKYATALLKLDTGSINMYQLPGEYSQGQYTASYWLANMDEISALVEGTFGYDTSKITLGKAGTRVLSYTDGKSSANRTDNTPSVTQQTQKTTETISDNAEKKTDSNDTDSTKSKNEKTESVKKPVQKAENNTPEEPPAQTIPEKNTESTKEVKESVTIPPATEEVKPEVKDSQSDGGFVRPSAN